jgi:uncharacterized delta-60 repeat protein
MKNIKYLLFVISVSLLSNLYSQQPGYLDESFGDNGIVVSDFGSSENYFMESSVIQPDGKIVAVGYQYSGNGEVGCMARYEPDGNLDSGFGTNGWETYNLTADLEIFNDIAIQSDGKYVVVGVACNNGCDFIVCRINQDGTLDNSFGTSGFTVIDAEYNSIAGSIVIQPDGKIVIAGSTSNGSSDDYDAVICRLNYDGTIDNTFTGDGIVVQDLHGNSDDIVRGLAIHDSKILICGMAFNGNSSDYDALALAQFNTDGLLDIYFGINGISIYDDINQENTFVEPSTNLTITQDDKILVSTHKTGIEGNDVVVLKFQANGYPDNSFGEYGMVLYDMINSTKANSLIEQEDGKIVVAGYNYYSGASKFCVLRFQSNGDIDESFGEYGGVAMFDISNGYDIATSISIQNDSKILVSGYSFDTKANFTLLRLYSGLETGMDETVRNNEVISVFPNPSNSNIIYVKYSLTNSERIHISLLSIDGNITSEIYSGIKKAGEHTDRFELQEYLPAGSYILQVSTEESTIFSGKILVGK